MNNNKGKIFVIAGPSGVGKGTLLTKYLAKHPEVKLSVSATTRKPRPGEVHGKNYYFLEKEEFLNLIQKDQLIEYAQFADNYYGTLFSTVEEAANNGENIALEIEVQGALQIKEKIKDAILIFILPPSYDELKARLTGRQTETPEAIEKRLKTSRRELEAKHEFHHHVINDNLDKALEDLENTIGQYLWF